MYSIPFDPTLQFGVPTGSIFPVWPSVDTSTVYPAEFWFQEKESFVFQKRHVLHDVQCFIGLELTKEFFTIIERATLVFAHLSESVENFVSVRKFYFASHFEAQGSLFTVEGYVSTRLCVIVLFLRGLPIWTICFCLVFLFDVAFDTLLTSDFDNLSTTSFIIVGRRI